MTKHTALILVLCMMLSLAACGSKEPPATVPTTAPVTSAPTTAPTTEPTVPEPTVDISMLPSLSTATIIMTKEAERAEQVQFEYTYPNVMLVLSDAAIADTVMVELLNRIDATRSTADSVLSNAGSDVLYFYDVHYDPMRIDPNVLSLYGSKSGYAGGAHPSHESVSVTYDLSTGNVLLLSDLFHTGVSASDLSPLVIEGLDLISQEKQLYSDYTATVEERFGQGLDVEAGWYLSGEGLCIYFSPYDIAPYAAGTITATIPYSQLNGILRDEFFPAERGNSGGSIIQAPFQTAQLDQFQQFTEVILDRNAEVYLLYTDGQLFDVTLETGTYSEKYDSFTPLSTVFACEALSMNDAIMVQSDDVLRLTYQSGDSTVSTILK